MSKLWKVVLATSAIILSVLPPCRADQLQPKTSQGFDRYIRAAEARMTRDREKPGRFLYIDSLPDAERNAVIAQLRQGNIYVTRLKELDDKGNPIEAPDGWIHDWIAAMFIPRATLKQAVAVDQDYDKYSSYYKPDMIRSRILDHQDDTYKVYARVRKTTPWLTFTLDIYNNVHFVFVDSRHLYSISRSFRIQQVEDADTAKEHLDPPGTGSGFLWALNVYWRYEAVEGGILVESESIGLTRSLPYGLGWIVKPFVRRATTATERDVMIRTREVIEQEAKDQAGDSHHP